MIELKPLYKIDSKGKTRVYKIEMHNNGAYTTSAGILDGALVSKTYAPKPKGKNTQEEQAEKDALSKWTRKKDRELYVTDITCAAAPLFTAPMLALDATKVGHRIKWGERLYLTQPKLNGVRCIATKLDTGRIELTSRKGKVYKVPHISSQVETLMRNPMWPTGNQADGELYIHGVELGDITHAVAHGDTRLEYRIFDMVCEHTCGNRLTLLESIQPNEGSKVSIVPSTPVNNIEDVKKLHAIHEKDGYEGIMIRDSGQPYMLGPSKTDALFKYKTFQDSEFEIVDVEQDKEGGAILVLTTDKGIHFNSRPMGTDEFRQQLWKDRLNIIGLQATSKYSTLLTSGVPEFNRTIAIRNYE